MFRPKLTSLIHHRKAMLLLDDYDINDDGFCAFVRHERPHVFTQPDGSVPSWVGIEYMAQTASAWAGWRHLKENEKIQYCLLLSVRHYTSYIENFKQHKCLNILVNEVRRIRSLGIFACKINDVEGNLLVQAQITGVEVPTIKQLKKYMDVLT